MKSLFLLHASAAALLLVVASAASARDDRLKFPIADAAKAAETTAKADGQLDPDIKLFWGTQSHAKPTQSFGTFTANKKTNFFNKTDKEGCEWAWLSAVLSLQDRAKKEGGNAVVGIKSVYKNGELDSATEYECGAGAVMGGVALRGQVVKLP